MKKAKTFFLSLLALLVSLNAGIAQKSMVPHAMYQVQGNGIPATPHPVSYKQPDGTIINMTLKGDAAIHWAVSEDGYTLIANQKGIYEYARLDANANLISTGIAAKNASQRKSNETAILQSIPKGIGYSGKQIKQKMTGFRKTSKSQAKSFPSSGARNNLVILVDFPDKPFSHTVSDVDNLMNQPGYGGIGSFKDFYYTNSYGKLTVNTTVVGIYTALKPHDYYGQNDINGNDSNVVELMNEAIMALDATVDFSMFDNDSNGVVDCVYIMYAGTGEASSGVPSDIWPHNNPHFPAITVDGVIINAYTCSNELNGTNLAGIGTICHEFGHALGLPDYYDTDYAGSGGQAAGNGSWDVMASGNSNGNEASPANHNPMSKKMLGWLNPVIIHTDGLYTLPAATRDTVAFVVNALLDNEGFFMENRQPDGFDGALAGHGMLIYHCDYTYFEAHRADNNINADPTHQGFDLEEADGETTSELGDTYPGLTSNTNFTDASTPNSLLWSGANLNYPVVGIVEDTTAKTIQFNISGFTGINDLTPKNNIQVYPTIANSYIDIKSNEMIQNVWLIDLQGNVISQGNINALNTRINLTNVSAGTYFVKTSSQNRIFVAKILVVH